MASDTIDSLQIIHESKVYTLRSLPENLKQLVLDNLKGEASIVESKSVSSVFSISDLFKLAEHYLPRTIYSYFSTGSSHEFSLRENENAYSRIWFNPKVLVSVSQINSKTKILGDEVQLPIYITAFAGSSMDGNVSGEKPLVAAAEETGILAMIPGLTTFDISELAMKSKKNKESGFALPPQWFQIYIRESIESVKLTLRELGSNENIKAVVFTVDVSQLGNRLSYQRETNQPGRGVEQMASSLNWDHLVDLKNFTKLKVILKGIQSIDDAVKAAQLGFHGIIISNHGGRQLDFSKSSIEILTEIVPELKRKGLYQKIEIYIDGGIRTGGDVVKALALGAKAVGLGRPFLYALHLFGKDGILKVIEILRYEMELTLRLLGVDNIENLNESYVDISNLKNRSLK